MSFAVQSITHPPNQTFTFDFGSANVIQYVVGISYWDFRFDSTDQRISEVSLSLAPSASGGQVLVTPTAVLKGGSHNMDTSKSLLTLSCVAVLSNRNDDVTLTTELGVANSAPSVGFPLCSNTPNLQDPFLAGFNLAYPSDKKHHVQEIYTTAGFKADGTTGFITGQSNMLDRGNPDAAAPTIDGGVVYTDSSVDELLGQTKPGLQTTGTVDVDLGVPLSDAVVLLNSLTVKYEGNQTHDIMEVGGGCPSWTTDGSSIVKLTSPRAFMRDNSGNDQSDSSSSVTMIVIGIKA